MTRIAVIGASGFVGSAVVDAARSAGHDTLSLSGPRLATADTTHEDVITALAAQLGDVDAVVNCAGNPDASAARIEDLEAANSVLPGVIGAAARRGALSVTRVHRAVARVRCDRGRLDRRLALAGRASRATRPRRRCDRRVTRDGLPRCVHDAAADLGRRSARVRLRLGLRARRPVLALARELLLPRGASDALTAGPASLPGNPVTP